MPESCCEQIAEEIYFNNFTSIMIWNVNQGLMCNKTKHWSLQSFREHYSLDSHPTHVNDETYNSSTSTPKDIFFFFEKLFHGKFYLLSEFLPEICWQEIAEEIFFKCVTGRLSQRLSSYLLQRLHFENSLHLN